MKGNIKAAIAKAFEDMANMSISPLEVRYKLKRDGSVLLLFKDCYMFRGCEISNQSGLLYRADGTTICLSSAFLCHYISEATGNEWNYVVIKFKDGKCVAHCTPLHFTRESIPSLREEKKKKK